MNILCVRVVTLETSSGYFTFTEKVVPYKAALASHANSYGVPPSPTAGLLAWQMYCEDAGRYALGLTVPGWPTNDADVVPSTSGGPIGWDPSTGGVAFGPHVDDDGDAVWAEFFPCTDAELDSRTLELEICNDSKSAANGVLLEFTFGRTEILRASTKRELPGKRIGYPLDTIIIDRPQTKAFTGATVPPGGHVTLSLTYRMDPPAFRTSQSNPPKFFVTWLAPNGTPPPAAPDRFAPLPSPLQFDGSPAAVAAIRSVAHAHEPNVEQMRARRDADIAATAGNRHVYKKFFATLDHNTNPRLGAHGARAYMSLKRVLQDRFVRRASGPGVGSLPTPQSLLLERELVRKVATRVAAQLQAMIESSFGTHLLVLKAGNAPNFEEALEMFASGSLTSFDAQGAPDGPMMLALGEFALLLEELSSSPIPTTYMGQPVPAVAASAPDIDWSFWKHLLPVMCRVSEIFARCYHNPWPGQSYTMQAYTPNDNPNGRRGLDPYGPLGAADLAVLKSIRNAWSLKETAAEFACTVASALRDDPLLVTNGPHKVMPLIKPELAGRTWQCANEVGGHEPEVGHHEPDVGQYGKRRPKSDDVDIE